MADIYGDDVDRTPLTAYERRLIRELIAMVSRKFAIAPDTGEG